MNKYKYDISIIIPVYNNENYIDECMHSIINQNFNLNRIQIILINDGSKDNSLNVMKKYKRKNILIIDKESIPRLLKSSSILSFLMYKHFSKALQILFCKSFSGFTYFSFL